MQANPRIRARRATTLALVGLLAGLVVASCGAEVTATTPIATVAPGTLAGSLAPGGLPSLSAAAASRCASGTLAEMTEAQRIGQLFMLGIEGDSLSADETYAIRTYDLGSVWLAHWRTGGRDEIRPLTDEVQSMATRSTTAGVRFFVGADQEGGTIQRIKGPGFVTIPSALDQGMLDPTLLQADASVWGSELMVAGVNLNLAPVTDVVPPGADATNEPIGALQREFGHDPATVGSHSAAVVRGMLRAGVATTLKHFPGLGRVAGNTDTAAGVVDSATTATDPYLDAFRTAIAAGPAMVMVSLAKYRLIDPDRQAVFSPAIIGGLLRGKLGFDGVVVSDDLGMAAAVAAIPAGARAVDFVAAGGDLITVLGPAQAVEMATALGTRASTDAAFRSLVADAALRVLRAKADYGLVACPS